MLPLLLLMLCLALLLSGALPALSLFLPALLMMALEQEAGRPMTRILLLFGLLGAWDALDGFWHASSLRAADWMALLDLHALALAWLAQAAGWLLAEGLALLLSHLSARDHARMRARTEAQIAELRAEWRL